MRIAFLGDINGAPGRQVLTQQLPLLRERFRPDCILANAENAKAGSGVTPEQFQQTMAEVAGLDLTAWFADAVSSTKELDFAEALGYYGLRFTPVDLTSARPTMGATTRNDNGRLVVSVVRRGTPAHEAGVNVDDEILAIDDLRVRADGLVARMDQYKVGDKVRLLVARRDRLVTLDVTLTAEPGRPWRLQPAPDQTTEQKARLEAWIGR